MVAEETAQRNGCCGGRASISGWDWSIGFVWFLAFAFLKGWFFPIRFLAQTTLKVFWANQIIDMMNIDFLAQKVGGMYSQMDSISSLSVRSWRKLIAVFR